MGNVLPGANDDRLPWSVDRDSGDPNPQLTHHIIISVTWNKHSNKHTLKHITNQLKPEKINHQRFIDNESLTLILGQEFLIVKRDLSENWNTICWHMNICISNPFSYTMYGAYSPLITIPIVIPSITVPVWKFLELFFCRFTTKAKRGFTLN